MKCQRVASPFFRFSVCPPLLQIVVTFVIVFGVILYRISIKAALHMSSYPAARSNVRATVKTTAAIINLIVIIILDEVYGAIARWLTALGEIQTSFSLMKKVSFNNNRILNSN